MFKKIVLLEQSKIEELKTIASSAQFADGKITNPHSKVKNNLQLHDMQPYEQSSRLMLEAMGANREFNDFAFPEQIAPPMITRYQPGMHYGLHTDAAIMQLPTGPIRADLSCTIFLNDPDSYEGGALHIRLGEADMRFKEPAGTAIVYPSNTFHEVEPVTEGERMVAITFIQSRIANTEKRNLLYELNEVAALEGLNMSDENYARMQAVQFNLMRFWTGGS